MKSIRTKFQQWFASKSRPTTETLDTSTDVLSRIQPLYDGMPAIVRLVRGPDILCWAFIDTVEQALIVECPLVVTYSQYEDDADDDTVTVREHIGRWMPQSSATRFRMASLHIMGIAPLAPSRIESYINAAHQLYQPAMMESDEGESLHPLLANHVSTGVRH